MTGTRRSLLTDESTEETPDRRRRRSEGAAATKARLVVLYDAADPARAGETLLLEGGGPFVLGRDKDAEVGVRQRPEGNDPGAPWSDPRVSRRQLEVHRLSATRLSIENHGRAALVRDGAEVQQTTVSPGDMLLVADRCLLACVARPTVLPAAPYWPHPVHPPGAPDPVGIVGESVEAWALRDRLGFVAQRREHVLVLGPSGAGKELVARGLHALGARRSGPWVARNTATIPDSLTDAELFGVVADYPNAGSPARSGMIREADGGTLFLDEIGEMPEAMQAHLLRFMDGGEYRALGDERTSRAELRLVAATNRDRSALKHDLIARFVHTIEVPALAARMEDIPLIAQHLLREMLAEEPQLAARLCDDDGQPRIDPELLRQLCGHPLALQVRELQKLLWDALALSRGDYVEPLAAALVPAPPTPAVDPSSLTRADLERALAEVDGSHREIATHLGLANRYVLRRLLKRHGLG